MNLIRRVALALDRSKSRSFERETQRSLDRATNSRRAEQNLGRMDKVFGRIKAAAVGVGAAIAGAFAARKIVGFFRSALDTSVEAEAIWNRLGGQLEALGFRFDDVEAKVRAVAEQMQQTTRVGDEKFATILQELVSTSGDLAGSLRNVSVVADLAAAKQIDLKTSAQLVGRAMVGQTSTLTRYGIIVGKNQDAVEVLRETFKGMAENETKSLSGQTEQLRNAYDDLLEAIGRVITTTAGGGSILQTFTDRIRTLTFWIDQNTEGWRRLQERIEAVWSVMQRIGNAIPFGRLAGFLRDRALGDLFVGTGVEINQFAATVEEMEANVAKLTTRLAELATETNFGKEGAEKAQIQYHNTAAALERWTKSLGDLIAAEKAIANLKPRPSVADAESQESGGIRFGPRPDTPAATLDTSPLITTPITALAEQQQIMEDVRRSFLEAMLNMERAGLTTAFSLMQGWGDAFQQLFTGAAGFDDFMEAIFASVAKAGLQGLAEFAAGKVSENIAQGFEALAEAAAMAATGNLAGAAAMKTAATGHFLAAAKWAAVGAVAGGAAGAIGGGGASGGGGGRGLAAGDTSRGEEFSPEVHVYIDPLNPDDFRLQETVAIAMNQAGQTLGSRHRVTVHRRTK